MKTGPRAARSYAGMSSERLVAAKGKTNDQTHPVDRTGDRARRVRANGAGGRARTRGGLAGSAAIDRIFRGRLKGVPRDAAYRAWD